MPAFPLHEVPGISSLVSRRRLLAGVGATYATAVLAGCAGTTDRRVHATSNPVAVAEERRRRRGARVHDVVLTAAPVTLDLAGLVAPTWGYNGTVPGPEIRVRAGDVVRARLVNRVPASTTIHWHGVALRNDMDGVPGVTQPSVEPDTEFLYEFTVPDAGSFWFHPHTGLQLDRGLYAPLVIEDPSEPGDYDREYNVVLDDWVDGIGQAPEEILDTLRAGGGAHAAHGKGAAATTPANALGGHTGDVTYPLYLVNGRPPKDPAVLDAKPGERLRLRILNAGADSPFRVALGGHRLTVTHTDGFPVEPVIGDAVIVGMAERYDVTVTVAGSGAFPLVAAAEGKGNQAMAIVRSGPGPAPPPDARPSELDGRLLSHSDLVATPGVALRRARPDRSHRVVLGGGEQGYRWTINGRTHDDARPLHVREGEMVRLVFENRTTMFHPMHLHGHTFQVAGSVTGSGRRGARKDTVIIQPKELLAVDLAAENPGQWMLHCHNIYHMEGGMMTTLSYVR